jgi:hypothetical protein
MGLFDSLIGSPIVTIFAYMKWFTAAKEEEYKNFVRPDRLTLYRAVCQSNCYDFYSTSIIFSGQLCMDKLMQHKSHKAWRRAKVTPKEAWDDAMKNCSVHSNNTAGAAASMVMQFSPRGREFAKWYCKEYDINFKKVCEAHKL